MIYRDSYDRPYSEPYDPEIKYSRSKNRTLGIKRGVGQAKESDDNPKSWPKEDVQDTGLVEREPL